MRHLLTRAAHDGIQLYEDLVVLVDTLCEKQDVSKYGDAIRVCHMDGLVLCVAYTIDGLYPQ